MKKAMFSELLEETYEATKEQMESAGSIEELRMLHENAMNYYCKEMIPGFFSSGGEGNALRKMYADLEQHRYSRFVIESSVPVIDLNVAGHIYKEYLDGMCSFITETCGYCIDGELYAKESTTCEDKLQRAHENDGKFIESIFGGSNNSAQNENILESVKNIEFLVSFLDDLKTESATCGVVIDQVKKGIADHPDSQKLLTESTRMMVESVNDYVYHVIRSVFESYQDITNVLETKGKVAPQKKGKKTCIW